MPTAMSGSTAPWICTTSDGAGVVSRTQSPGSRCPSVVAAVRSDGLYPPSQQAALHSQLAALDTDSEWVDIDSPHGHDGFLIETAQLGKPIEAFLDRNDPLAHPSANVPIPGATHR